MKPKLNIFIILLSVAFLQCSTNKKVLNNKDNNMIKDLIVFPPYSIIDVIETRDKRMRSEAFSQKAENEIKNHLVKYIPSSINSKYLECDSSLKEKIIIANMKLIKTVKGSLVPGKVAVDGYLTELLDSLDNNYGLFLFHVGFTRTKENLKNEYIRRKELGLVSLGFYNTEPNSTYSIMIGILVDKQRKRISMYKELYWRNRNPNEEVVIRTQVRDIILSYFQQPL